MLFRSNAMGEATIYRRQLEASGILHLGADGMGVPFTVSGPVDKPKASVAKGSFVAATIGAAMPPGTGNGIGARISGAVRRIFKGGEQQPVDPAPVAPEKN